MARSRSSNFPQLGGEPVSVHRVDAAGEPKFTKAGRADMGLKFPGNVDLKDPVAVRAAVGNFAHSLESAPVRTHLTGAQWYPKVHDAVSKGIGVRGFMSHAEDRHLSGAGIVAAVSPNMDWDRGNIDAFGELSKIKSKTWDSILAADPHGKSDAAKASRAAAQEHVRGMSISAAPIGNLQKAGRLIRGEDPETVLPRGTAPKTNSFMHNIADPANPHHVTIDGRAFDTLTNRMRPWETGRGIGTANLARGTSRYEDAANVVKGVAAIHGIHPSEAQAISWEHVKYNLEQDSGARKQGPARRGQPYFDTETGAPALHHALGAQFRR